VLQFIARRAGLALGIDNSLESLRLGASRGGRARLACMDAGKLAFPDSVFDRVVCIQNGISAFHADRRALIAEALRVTRPGGRSVFSTYAEGFWEHRLEWFEKQAAARLVGPIDYERTGDGEIVCIDGFTATTVGADEMLGHAEALGVEMEIAEVDGSSVFFSLTARP
jgi:2-polyprenyl-6-hydroxyphenyl methylase/3-demethylubiquinone-9 3-methyltransferase